MAQEQDQVSASDMTAERAGISRVRRRRWRLAGAILLGLTMLILGVVWAARKDIADNFIAGQLDSLGVPARYEIVAIGPGEQVIRNLVIGDPKRPDLTVKELRVATRLLWGLPGIGRITVVRPRLFGDVRNGRVSFGTLDKALFSGRGGPFEIPDLDVAIVDGRALMTSPYGKIGVQLEGEGQLRGGFRGEIAAISPRLTVGDCVADETSVYGIVSTASQKPSFEGPVRLGNLQCAGRDAVVKGAAAQLAITLDKALDGGEGTIGFNAGRSRLAANQWNSVSGKSDFAYRGQSLNARYKVTAKGIRGPQVQIGALSFDGRARSAHGLSRFDIEGDLSGTGVALGRVPDHILSIAQRAGTDTLVAPVMARMREALAREARGSSLAANLILRRSSEGLSLVVPHGALRGGSGASLLTLTRVQAMIGAGALPRVTGNFATGGRGLPQISGRMEGSAGRLALQVRMPEYGAGTARIAVPRLAMTQARSGAVTFDGQVVLSGDLPGGRADNLNIPASGIWAPDGALSVWPACTRIAFDRLQLASLSLDRRDLAICPASAGPILRFADGRMRIAAGVPSLELSGHLGETPVKISSGPLGYAQNGTAPGIIKASSLKVDLGPAASASHFLIADLGARVSGEIAGAFSDADISLYAVPLDLRNAAGSWGYREGVLTIGEAAFVLVDREKSARFEPMTARGASLRLEANRITAQADLREPKTDRAIVRADISHDLSRGIGHADLTVAGIDFDENLQAGMLSPLAVGVVSNLAGEVHGRGRIDWNAQGVTSSGRFSTKGVDFAAPFGPVKGMSGDVVFTDLLGLVTAPSQTLRIASVNPGIEAADGTLSFEMRPGHVLHVNGGQWPFMQGTLTLEPASMQIGVAETRRYTLKVTGLDAATFVQHLEMSNLSASGTFDGELPLVFDEDGGRIENGYLTSRPPGGNLSYVGELTYKDLSAMGNFAFDALKSVNYRSMQIGLGGSLTGDIVTRVSFDGLSQGTGASRNFLTKQIAKLPIRFVLNIKAPFFSLFGSVRSLYDPSYITDPRTLGLMSAGGVPATAKPHSTIQPSVSENKP